MKLIFCTDDKNGMMFFGKRQSQDSALRDWIIAHVDGQKLWMSLYSAKQFQTASGIIADDEYIKKASMDDYCFVEDKEFSLDEASEVILCRWNRRYQADKFLNIDLKAIGFYKISSVCIKGSSHDKITIETYKRGQ